MSDMQFVAELADVMGTKSQYMDNKLTVAEWIEYGWEKSGAQDMMTIDEWKEKQYVTAPAVETWQDEKAVDLFYNDRTATHRPASGLLEKYS
jgi:hypothetical protein